MQPINEYDNILRHPAYIEHIVHPAINVFQSAQAGVPITLVRGSEYRRAASVPLAVPAHVELRVDMAEQPALSAAE